MWGLVERASIVKCDSRKRRKQLGPPLANVSEPPWICISIREINKSKLKSFWYLPIASGRISGLAAKYHPLNNQVDGQDTRINKFKNLVNTTCRNGRKGVRTGCREDSFQGSVGWHSDNQPSRTKWVAVLIGWVCVGISIVLRRWITFPATMEETGQPSCSP